MSDYLAGEQKMYLGAIRAILLCLGSLFNDPSNPVTLQTPFELAHYFRNSANRLFGAWQLVDIHCEFSHIFTSYHVRMPVAKIHVTCDSHLIRCFAVTGCGGFPTSADDVDGMNFGHLQ